MDRRRMIIRPPRRHDPTVCCAPGRLREGVRSTGASCTRQPRYQALGTVEQKRATRPIVLRHVVSLVFGNTIAFMDDDWLTTGEVSSMLGVSRQHIVDLCNRGELTCVKTGTHRRIRRIEARRLLRPQLTREQEKSLWLHRALLGHLMADPQDVIQVARENITSWKPGHRADGMTTRYLNQWQRVIDAGIDDIVQVLIGTDEVSIELRQNSPFAGVLSDDERRQVLRSFREHWEHKRTAA